MQLESLEGVLKRDFEGLGDRKLGDLSGSMNATLCSRFLAGDGEDLEGEGGVSSSSLMDLPFLSLSRRRGRGLLQGD